MGAMGMVGRVGGNVDREHVSLSNEISCLYWEAKLGASRSDIRSAIDRVGEAPADVERWLSDAHKNHIRPTPDAAN